MTIRVLRAGVLATVQDLGRPGLQHLAIVPGGAMDPLSHRLANALVGNGEEAATLEIALSGPELAFAEGALVALHGARFAPEIDGVPMPVSRPVLVPAGARLRIGRAAEGAFGYLAVAGGIDVPPVLGSRSTYLAGAFGGWRGGAIRAGAQLPLVADAAALADARFARLARNGGSKGVGPTRAQSVRWSAPMLTLAATDPLVVRVVDGVHVDWFDETSRTAFLGERWRVAPDSNRMGYRLAGPKLALAAPREILHRKACASGRCRCPRAGSPSC